MIFNIRGSQVAPKDLNGEIINTAYDTYGSITPYHIIFDEEFLTFNTNIWSCRSGEYKEWQYLPEDYSNNAYVENGNLIVRNLKNNPVPDFEWSGAYVYSKNKFEFQYGTIISRIKFPNDADNYHATLWMLGDGPGEIDIAESDSGNVSAAVHYYDLQKNWHSKLIGFYPITANEFHTYQMDWTEKKIVFKCDGVFLGSFNVDDATIDGYNSFRQPMYMIFNTNPYSTSKREFATTNSVVNNIDYIKVYGNQNDGNHIQT